VNYTVPNHYEDYVHRVGRTGRAGKKGTAITFISPEEDRFAPDMVKALKQSSGQTVPEDLQKLADGFADKLRQGLVKYGSNSGYRSGKGFKFDETEAAEAKVDELEKRSGYLDSDIVGAEALNSIADEKYALEAKKLEEKEREKTAKEKKKIQNQKLKILLRNNLLLRKLLRLLQPMHYRKLHNHKKMVNKAEIVLMRLKKPKRLWRHIQHKQLLK